MRKIKGMVSSMLADCELPTEYWSYAAHYAAVVIMKTSKGIPTAWEALTGRAEGVGSLRRIGERCLVQVPRETRKKADFTEMKGGLGVFLGHTEGVSGWIVMMDKDGVIAHSRDVRRTPNAAQDTPPQREAVPHIPLPRPLVELGPVESDEEEAESDEEATGDQPEAGGAVERAEDLPAPPSCPPEVQTTGRVLTKDRWAMVPMDEPDPEPFEGPTSSSGRPLRPSKRLSMLASEMADVLGADGSSPLATKSVSEALSGPNSEAWLASMESEIAYIEGKETWSETKLLPGRRAVGCKWVFKVEEDGDGKVVKFIQAGGTWLLTGTGRRLRGDICTRWSLDVITSSIGAIS